LIDDVNSCRGPWFRKARREKGRDALVSMNQYRCPNVENPARRDK